ncbi:hypothetical protein [Microbacterium aerolatum]|uniref:hypothetical protein n=1 Tax=Microbacterium aerolatum TaxID=153731 RepID=UPI00384AA5C6
MSQTSARNDTRPMPGTRMRGYSSGLLLLLEVLVVPAALSLISNSWSAPDAEAYVRMAFAQVAGSVIAIGTVVLLVAQRIVRRSRIQNIAAFVFIAVAVILWKATNLQRTSDFLLNGLGVGS